MEEKTNIGETSPASLSTSSDKGDDLSISPKIEEDDNESNSPIEEAKKILEETKKALEETKKERIRIEKATAEALVNGRSYAGQAVKTETADEKWAREAKIRYAGTGMDPTPKISSSI